ncbi:MAG: NAD(P)-dependent methylenetetrahydromethanopterin dehydrogenase [Gemmataceae bacterium]
MSDKRKILIQLDSDPHPSVFDRVVAIDAGVDELFSYGNVQPDQVAALVHGAIFTRSPKDLRRTALFIGGSNVEAGETLLARAVQAMIPSFGLRVSVLLDANGANTTAAAAVRVAGKHLPLAQARALVLGGTGPVGQRVGLLLARQGAHVKLASRQKARAATACQAIIARVPQAQLEPLAIAGEADLAPALEDRTLVIAAGAAGVVLLPQSARTAAKQLQVAIDLNAVPPLGIEGVQVTDAAKDRSGVICYGAIGVGGTKMKLHRAAVARLFESNDQVMDAEEVYALGEGI